MSATNTSAQFDKYIGEAKPLLVEFYNPECSPELRHMVEDFI